MVRIGIDGGRGLYSEKFDTAEDFIKWFSSIVNNSGDGHFWITDLKDIDDSPTLLNIYNVKTLTIDTWNGVF